MLQVINISYKSGADSQPTPSGESSAGSPVRRKTMVGGTSIDDPDQAVKKALVDLRSLLICISMLQRINSVSPPPFNSLKDEADS
jgi:hypothetical protein